MIKKTFLENQKLREADFVISVPAKKCPHVIIYDVSRTDSDEIIMKALIKQNLEIKDKFCQQIRLIQNRRQEK